MINDAFGVPLHHVVESSIFEQPFDEDKVLNKGLANPSKDFMELVKGRSQELYEGCTKYSIFFTCETIS